MSDNANMVAQAPKPFMEDFITTNEYISEEQESLINRLERAIDRWAVPEKLKDPGQTDSCSHPIAPTITNDLLKLLLLFFSFVLTFRNHSLSRVFLYLLVIL